MKEKLLERMKLMEEAIARQQQAVNQAMADLNALHGSRQELNFIIAMADEPVLEAVPECSAVADVA